MYFEEHQTNDEEEEEFEVGELEGWVLGFSEGVPVLLNTSSLYIEIDDEPYQIKYYWYKKHYLDKSHVVAVEVPQEMYPKDWE
jgi:hypothetical protein